MLRVTNINEGMSFEIDQLKKFISIQREQIIHPLKIN